MAPYRTSAPFANPFRESCACCTVSGTVAMDLRRPADMVRSVRMWVSKSLLRPNSVATASNDVCADSDLDTAAAPSDDELSSTLSNSADKTAGRGVITADAPTRPKHSKPQPQRTNVAHVQHGGDDLQQGVLFFRLEVDLQSSNTACLFTYNKQHLHMRTPSTTRGGRHAPPTAGL